MGVLVWLRDWGRDPIVFSPLGTGSTSFALGTIEINVDDVRDLMRELQRRPPADAPATVYVQVSGQDAKYGVDELDKMTVTGWQSAMVRAETVARDFQASVTFSGNSSGTVEAATSLGAQLLADLVTRTLGAGARRPISAWGARRIRSAGVVPAAALLWLWFAVVARPAFATLVLSLAVTMTAAALLAIRLRGEPPLDYWEPTRYVRVVQTSRAEMDQRRHDRRRDARVIFWTVVISVPFSGVAGALISASNT